LKYSLYNGLYLILGVFCSIHISKACPVPNDTGGIKQRTYLIKTLTKIADPVLLALSKGELKKTMPVESQPGKEEDRKKYSYLEALGRLLSGMSPWLELGGDKTEEGKLREHYIKLSLASIKNAVDPKSPDYMNFKEGGQPLVDAAFLAEAFLRAPTQLWERLDVQTKSNVIAAFKETRAVKPPQTNWLLFAAIVEAFILKVEGKCEQSKIDYATQKHLEWYKGDGIYGDGKDFHSDYYNSFVIHPMFLEVLQVLVDAGQDQKKTYELELKRATRYAAIQERMISPEATYPPVGRSLAYRFGAFHLLAKMALLKSLPEGVEPQQVRAALYSVVKKQAEAKGTFDEKGWLKIGFYGSQLNIGEHYISTGSLYLCTEAFLVLGLPATDTFWTGGDKEWTQLKIWNGREIPIDHALEE
jgi:hypothetical protein